MSAVLFALGALLGPRAFAGDPAQLIDAVQRASDEGAGSITIPPGEYRVSPKGGVHVRWRNLKDLHINATGVRLVCTDPSSSALVIDGARDVTIEGLTIDYDPLPFTQGRIVAFEGHRRIKMRVDDGYSVDTSFFDGRLAGYLYERDGSRIKDASPDLYPTHTVADPDDPRSLWLEHRSDLPLEGHRVEIGDPIAIVKRVAGAVRLNDGERVTFQDVTVHAGGGIAIQESLGEGDNRYFGVRIVPGPPLETDNGPSVPRLVSSCADGIHSAYVHKGPLIEGCEFGGMGDDAMAVHGTYAIAVESSGLRSVVVSPKYSLPLMVGDTLRILDQHDQHLRGEARVSAITEVPIEKLDTPEAKVDELWHPYRAEARSRKYFRVSLESDISINAGDLAMSWDRVGAGFRFINNTVHPHRARAFMIKSVDGIIEGNTVNGSSHAGIGIGPEFSIWLGGPAGVNVIVRNNTFIGTGYQGSALLAPTNPISAAITVHAGTLSRVWSTSRPNRNIIIENNRVEHPAGPALMIASAEGVVVRNNQFELGERLPGATGTSAYGVDASMDVWFDECDDVVLEGNEFTGRPMRRGQAPGAKVIGLGEKAITPEAERLPWPETVASSPLDARILTPRPLRAARINGPRVFGATPGAPFRFTVPASGEKPIRFEADLPEGLTIDGNGVISGVIDQPGTQLAFVRATNAAGGDEAQIELRIGDTIGLTPPMGWNSWNCWGREVSQDRVLASARAMVETGLVDHGWTYVNIDDAWQAQRGGPRHAIQPNAKFPDMQGMCAELHAMGLKVGIYSTPWITSYAGFIGGSSDEPDGAWDRETARKHVSGDYRFAGADAAEWASWGIDYLKYDWFPNDLEQATEMHDALRATGRDIMFSLSNASPFQLADELPEVCNAARTTVDIRDAWRQDHPWRVGLADIWDQHERWAPFCKPGFFPDADMLVVGEVSWSGDPKPTQLTADEQYTHVSLWCLWSSPLLIGCPIERMDRFTLSLLTNDEVLAVNQDSLGVMGTTVYRDGDRHIVAKPMADGSIAVGLFNRGERTLRVAAAWRDLGFDGAARVRDLWRQRDLGVFEGSFGAEVNPHGVVLVSVRPEA